MHGRAAYFCFVICAPEMFNDLGLCDLKIMVAYKCCDAAGGADGRMIVVSNGDIKASGERRFQENSRDDLCAEAGGRGFVPGYGRAGFGAAKFAAEIALF